MGKPPGPGKCVHCLAEVAERDWDHVFPISWYPDTTPPDLEKWKIPSCLPCNHGYSKIEGDFRDRVGLCLDPDNPASQSIVEAAMRSIDAEQGRDPSDAQKRLIRARKLMSQTLHGAQIQEENLYPGMPRHEDVPAEDRVDMLIPTDYFPRMVHKIVRGMFYIHEHKFIEPPYVTDFYLPIEANAIPFEQLLNEFGTTYDRGPGLVVQRAVTTDKEFTSLFKMTFWEQISLYATVTREKP
jgi:hypothetical protein